MNLKDLAAKENATIKSANSINMKKPIIAGIGNEPLVVGTAFGLNESDISKPLLGNNGVYVIQVTNKTPAISLDSYQASANRVGRSKENAVNTQLYNALKEAAEIEDNRAVFY